MTRGGIYKGGVSRVIVGLILVASKSVRDEKALESFSDSPREGDERGSRV